MSLPRGKGHRHANKDQCNGDNMDWGKAEKEGDTSYQIPETWLFIHYYEALNILFRVENTLRVFVFCVLKNAFFDQWANIQISAEDSEQLNTISVVAKRRAAQAKGFGYLGYQVACPIMYLTGGELSRIITSSDYWKHFGQFFKGSKDLIKTKLDEISHIRNALAHFRPISLDDVEVIRQNAKQVLMVVESYLVSMSSATGVVPTNTSSHWYSDLNDVAAVCARHSYGLTRRQDAKGDWVELDIAFVGTVLSDSRGTKHRSVMVTVPWTSAMIRSFPGIGKYVTRVIEASYCNGDLEGPVASIKHCKFVFRVNVLEDHSREIADEFVKIVNLVDQEAALLSEDSLARGTLVRSARCTGLLREGTDRWDFRTSALVCPVSEDDPPEYWGALDFWLVDFVGGADRYPWMAVDVSRQGLI